MSDYTAHVTYGLLTDVLQVLAANGIALTDDNPRRYTQALVALSQMADAVAGPELAKTVDIGGPEL